jgi:hypothetical protein
MHNEVVHYFMSILTASQHIMTIVADLLYIVTHISHCTIDADSIDIERHLCTTVLSDLIG